MTFRKYQEWWYHYSLRVYKIVRDSCLCSFGAFLQLQKSKVCWFSPKVCYHLSFVQDVLRLVEIELRSSQDIKFFVLFLVPQESFQPFQDHIEKRLYSFEVLSMLFIGTNKVQSAVTVDLRFRDRFSKRGVVGYVTKCFDRYDCGWFGAICSRSTQSAPIQSSPTLKPKPNRQSKPMPWTSWAERHTETAGQSRVALQTSVTIQSRAILQ